MADNLLRMGRAGRPHGVRGEIAVDWHGSWTPEPGSRLYLGRGEGEPFALRVESLRRHNGRLLMKFTGIDDRTEVGKLTGCMLLAEREAAGAPAQDEVYAEDLAGYKVFLPDGVLIGTLDHVEFPAGQMIWSIMDGEGREILFPAEPLFIKSLDDDKREAVISPPPGLLDIYRA